MSLATGKSESWIADRTGHRSSTMIGRYKRIARTFDELRIGALASMNEAIPELRSPMDRPSDDDDGKEKPDILNDIGLLALRPHGDLNRIPRHPGTCRHVAGLRGFGNDFRGLTPDDSSHVGPARTGLCHPVPFGRGNHVATMKARSS